MSRLLLPTKHEAQDELVQLYSRIVEIHGGNGPDTRVGSTKAIALPGRGKLLDAQTFFSKDVLRVIFDHEDATDLVTIMRGAYQGEMTPAPTTRVALERVNRDDVREGVAIGMAAAAPLTERVPGHDHGTDLMINVFANLEAAMQIYGLDTTAPEPLALEDEDKEAGVMDQSAIDALFG